MRAELRWPLCSQTVTLYHADPAAQSVTRTVVTGAYLDHRRREVMDTAAQAGTAFLLIIPEASARWGKDYTLSPHDRVYDGEGPAVSYEQWPDFLPARVAGLAAVQYVDPKRLHGAPSHVEAGGWWTHAGSGAHSLTN
ncbi:MAG: hypothetical protein ACI4KN_05100 [Gemmiger sp.]